jgi:hypothetical protein
MPATKTQTTSKVADVQRRSHRAVDRTDKPIDHAKWLLDRAHRNITDQASRTVPNREIADKTIASVKRLCKRHGLKFVFVKTTPASNVVGPVTVTLRLER